MPCLDKKDQYSGVSVAQIWSISGMCDSSFGQHMVSEDNTRVANMCLPDVGHKTGRSTATSAKISLLNMGHSDDFLSN